jgi:hypothetical protein
MIAEGILDMTARRDRLTEKSGRCDTCLRKAMDKQNMIAAPVFATDQQLLDAYSSTVVGVVRRASQAVGLGGVPASVQ